MAPPYGPLVIVIEQDCPTRRMMVFAFAKILAIFMRRLILRRSVIKPSYFGLRSMTRLALPADRSILPGSSTTTSTRIPITVRM